MYAPQACLLKVRAENFEFAELCGCFCKLSRDAGDPGALCREVETYRFTTGDDSFEDFFENCDFSGVGFGRVKRVLNGFEDALYIWSCDDTRELREIEPLERNWLEANKSGRHQNFFRIAEVDLDEVVAFGIGAVENAFEISR